MHIVLQTGMGINAGQGLPTLPHGNNEDIALDSSADFMNQLMEVRRLLSRAATGRDGEHAVHSDSSSESLLGPGL